MKQSPDELRKQMRRILIIGMLAFLAINGCSWNPGYGGRNDKKPGVEVERYFGWPACFYADLWRTDEPISILEIEPWDYAPPIPITNLMYYVYCSFGIFPVFLNLMLAAAVTGVCIIFCYWKHQNEISRRSIALALLLFAVSLTIVVFADKVSVYL